MIRTVALRAWRVSGPILEIQAGLGEADNALVRLLDTIISSLLRLDSGKKSFFPERIVLMRKRSLRHSA
jgi:hypothetical protein